MANQSVQQIQLIPISEIDITNPRVRNKKSFQELVESIKTVGLKRPITVTPRRSKEGCQYSLICGQGRMEALVQLEEKEVPAFVIQASSDDAMIKSLVENCARRQHTALDLLHDVAGMKTRGYSDPDIAQKTGLSSEYVRGVSNLMDHGEQRLLRAVESGQLPLSVAVKIASSPDGEVQNALQEAYENNELRGRKLLVARRLVENRRRRGKGLRVALPSQRRKLSSAALIRAYQEDTDRKKILVRKSNAVKSQLLFLTHALRELLSDADFLDVLEAEQLDTLPKGIVERIQRSEAA